MPLNPKQSWLIAATALAATAVLPTTASAATAPAPKLTLIDAASDDAIKTLVSGVGLNLATLPSRKLSVRAVPAAGAGSVGFVLDGVTVRTENQAPYSIAGDDSNGDYYAWTPSTGSHTLKVRSYTGANRTGTASATASIAFTVTDVPLTAPRADLVNADTDKLIAGYDPLINGDTINLAKLPSRKLSVRATTSASAASVGFVLDGVLVRTENQKPYSIAGDDGKTNFYPTTFKVGAHVLKLTAYSAADRKGKVGPTTTIGFTVVDRPATSPVVTAPVVTAPVVTAPDPVVVTPDPVVSTPAPTPDPVVTVPDPVVTTPDPVVTTPDPVVTVPDPVVTTPDPVVTVPDPVVTTPDPVVTTPTPQPDLSKLRWYTDYNSIASTTSMLGVWQAEQEPATNMGDGTAFSDRIRVSSAPGDSTDTLKPATKVMRVELRPWDNLSIAGLNDGDVTNTGGYRANRAEVYSRYPTTGGNTPPANWPDPVGSIRWYGLSIYMPEDFVTNSDSRAWMTVAQWKGQHGSSPPRSIEVHRDELAFGGTNTRISLGSIARGRWTRIVVGMKLGTSTTSGWSEVYRDGVLKVARRGEANMGTQVSGDPQPGQADPIYLKHGIYRGGPWTSTNVVYYGPTSVGDTMDDVK